MEALSRRVLEGRLENLPPEKKTDVAVFLSSTFTGACLYMHVYYNIEFDISPTKVILDGKPYISNFWSLSSFACNMILIFTHAMNYKFKQTFKF